MLCHTLSLSSLFVLAFLSATDDHTRVKLTVDSEVGGSDFINASYVPVRLTILWLYPVFGCSCLYLYVCLWAFLCVCVSV